MLTIDFETFSKADLKKVGAFKYAEDPSTEILCLCYSFPDENKVHLWTPESNELPFDLFRAIEAGELIEAHNAGFEWVIWNLVGTQKYNFRTPLPLKQLYCSAAKAAALSLPRSLDDVGKALDAEIKKDKDGHRIMLQLSKPRKPTKNNPDDRFTKEKFPDKFLKLYDYCSDDVLAEKASSEKMPELSASERKVYMLDQRINKRGIYCDVKLCKVAIGFAEKIQDKLLKELHIITDGQVQTARQVVKFRDWLLYEGVDLPNLQADTVADALTDGSIEGKARRALEIRQQLSKSSISKFEAMVRMACEDNRIRGTILYHGASTGRFSGKGIQPQNFIRGTVKDLDTLFEVLEMNDFEMFEMLYGDDAMNALASATRGMLRAAPGHDLLAGDYAAIEARALFWLCDCESGLKVFRKDEDIYKDMATTIYKILISQVTKDQRQLGKQAILGLGYGMGWRKFIETCANYGMVISEKLAKRVVEAYRSRFADVVQFWRDIEKAAIQAVKTGRVVKCGKLKWGVKGKYLFCQLPSGRKISYYAPQIRTKESPYGPKETLSFMGVDTYTRKWSRQYTYGGKLVENVTQAAARDLMVNSMFNCEKKDYKIVFTVHDEIVTEVRKNFGSVEEFEKIMSVLPLWAPGFPMKVEAWRGERFKK